jgi:hypothetical protein
MPKHKPGKRGRPLGSVAEHKRDVLIQLKVFAEERDAYRQAMEKSGLSTMAAWIRMQLNKSIQGESGE